MDPTLFLARLIEHWPESAMDKSLLIVSGKGGDVLLREYLFGKPVKIDLQYLEWGINTLLLAARRAYAVIPSSTDSYKRYASNNRLAHELRIWPANGRDHSSQLFRVQGLFCGFR